MGYGLMLPAVAVLHVRHAAVRQSGAILGTIAGTAAVTVGLGGSANADLRPAALFVLGMWWWTIGKTWVETGVLSRSLGLATAALGSLAILFGVLFALGTGLATFVPDFPYVPLWTGARVGLGVWLVALAAALYARSGAVPSR